MAEWLKDHVTVICSLNSTLWFNWWNLVKLETGRALREKWRQLVGKVDEWYMESWHLQGYSPRLCRLRTDGLPPHEQVLNILIVCWWYEPSNTSSLPSIDVWLFPHCFIGWLGRETGYRLTSRSANVMWIVSGALFSGAVVLLNSIDGSWKVAMYEDRSQEAYTGRT
jgi:hypothetical protein